jgi:hypothetical protein
MVSQSRKFVKQGACQWIRDPLGTDFERVSQGSELSLHKPTQFAHKTGIVVTCGNMMSTCVLLRIPYPALAEVQEMMRGQQQYVEEQSKNEP